MQRADGAFGALIIREPFNELPQKIQNALDNSSNFHLMIVHDWNHKPGVGSFGSFHHSTGNNKPENILINGKGAFENASNSIYFSFENFEVSSKSRYHFRLINSGFLNCPLELSIDNHTILIIASDGHYLDPISVDSLISYAGERFDFILNADQEIGSYWIRIRGLMDCDERFAKVYQGAILQYVGAQKIIPKETLSYDFKRNGVQMNSLNRGPGYVDSIAIVETSSLEPDTPELLLKHTDYKFYVHYDFYDKDFPKFNNPDLYSIWSVPKEENKFFGPQLNDITMHMPSLPLLIGGKWNDEETFCNFSSLRKQGNNCQKNFCECTHVLQVPLNATVELILIDEGYKYDANHPFHLHGHDFRVVAMERIQPTGVTVDQVRKPHLLHRLDLDTFRGVKWTRPDKKSCPFVRKIFNVVITNDLSMLR